MDNKYYLIKEDTLKQIANIIKIKNGESLDSTFSLGELQEKLAAINNDIQKGLMDGTIVIAEIMSTQEKIEPYAYKDAQGIKDLYFMNENLIIGEGAFQNSSLEKLVLNNTMTDIPVSMLEGTKITNFNIPNAEAVTSIGSKSFCNCAFLTTINDEELTNLETIGDNAFSGSEELISMQPPSKIKKIGQRAFFGDNALEYIPDLSQVTEIGPMAFAVTKIKNSFKNGQKGNTLSMRNIEKIGKEAFKMTKFRDNNGKYYNSKLDESNDSYGPDYGATIEIYSSEDKSIKIDNNAFYQANILALYWYPSKIKTLGSSIFRGAQIGWLSIDELNISSAQGFSDLVSIDYKDVAANPASQVKGGGSCFYNPLWIDDSILSNENNEPTIIKQYTLYKMFPYFEDGSFITPIGAMDTNIDNPCGISQIGKSAFAKNVFSFFYFNNVNIIESKGFQEVLLDIYEDQIFLGGTNKPLFSIAEDAFSGMTFSMSYPYEYLRINIAYDNRIDSEEKIPENYNYQQYNLYDDNGEIVETFWGPSGADTLWGFDCGNKEVTVVWEKAFPND